MTENYKRFDMIRIDEEGHIMKSLLAAILMVLVAFSALPAFAKTRHSTVNKQAPHLVHPGKKVWNKKKGHKIAKHFSPHRKAKLKKWQQGEVKRKGTSRYKQYFSGNKKSVAKKRG